MYFMCIKQAYMRRECAGNTVQYTGGWTVRLPTSSLFHIFEYLLHLSSISVDYVHVKKQKNLQYKIHVPLKHWKKCTKVLS